MAPHGRRRRHRHWPNFGQVVGRDSYGCWWRAAPLADERRSRLSLHRPSVVRVRRGADDDVVAWGGGGGLSVDLGRPEQDKYINMHVPVHNLAPAPTATVVLVIDVYRDVALQTLLV